VDARLVGGARSLGINNQGGAAPQFSNEHAETITAATNSSGNNVCGCAIALDGDKLKPREDQRKGGNGFGINEDGAGYTLTGVDRHGVAYCADGGNVAATITRQISEQSGQDNRANAVVVSMAQNTRDEVRIVGGDGQIAGALPAEPGMKQQTYIVRTQGLDGYNKTLTGDCAPTISGAVCDLHHTHGVISTNSNGEDVAATLTRDLAKQTGAQQQNGGGYCLIRRIDI
jgi:hypothetical protein